MTAKESKAVARYHADCASGDAEGGWVKFTDNQSALHAAEAERDAFRKELLLMEHKVITCGVAASHPDKLLTTHGAYKTKWDSPQAQSVRELRDAKDAAEAELGELRRQLVDANARGDSWRDRFDADTAVFMKLRALRDRLSEHRMCDSADIATELRQLLASDGGADGDSHG